MRRRTWLFVLLAVVGAALLIPWLAGPRLACIWLGWRAPLPSADGAAILTGAACIPGPIAPITVRLDADRLHAIASQGGTRWVPRWALGTGQSFWGTLTPAGNLPWRVAVVEERILTVDIRLTPSETAACAARLAGTQASRLELDHLALDTLPCGSDGTRRYAVDAAGRIGFRWGVGAQAGELAIPVRRLRAMIVLRPDGTRLGGSIRLDEFDADVPLLGSSLRPTAEKTLNQALSNALKDVAVPPWFPWDAAITIRAGIAEL